MKTKITIGSAFETIAKETLDSKFCKESMTAIANAVRFLKKNMGLTLMQSYVLSVVLENAGETVTCQSLAEYAGISCIRIMSNQKLIDNLVNRGFLNSAESIGNAKWDMRYSATVSLINAVRYNHELVPIDYSETSWEDMWQIISGKLHDCDYNALSFTCMVREIKSMFSSCGHIEFCRKLNGLNLTDENLVLLLIVCKCLINDCEEYASTGDYDDIIPRSSCARIVHQFKTKTSELVLKDLLKATDEDCNEYRLTSHAIQDLLGEEYLTKTENEVTDSNTKAITAKQMFYNPEETAQIDRLCSLLEQDNFTKIQERMGKAGMRPGICILFHGAPGTGKTETVLQLARQTGREIIQVNVSNIKDKYVGESEKNIQAVFSDYKAKLAESCIAPILLFNEADAILGKRYTGINSEVEQMSNAIQNIILQAMEDFEGILIATTNLTDNLDKAFERRFLYKIEFKKPTEHVRKKIWLSLIPDLGENNADALARRYDFNGGQIENVARRIMVDSILYGRTISGQELVSICDREYLSEITFKKTKSAR